MELEKNDPLPRDLLSFLTAVAPNRIFFATLLASLAGFGSALFVPLVTRAIALAGESVEDPEHSTAVAIFGFAVSTPRYAVAFLLLCLFILVTRTASAVLLQRVTLDASRQLRVRLYERIAQLPIIELERIGSARLNAALAADVPTLVAAAASLPAVLAGVTSIAGLLGFLIYLNVEVFVLIVACILLGVVTYRVPVALGNRYYARARATLDGIQRGIEGLIGGAKELKLNHAKRIAFLEEVLLEAEERYRCDSRRGGMLLQAALNYANLIAFLVLGLVTFVMSAHYAIEPATLAAIAMALIFVTGLLGPILNAVSPLVRGTVALRSLRGLFEQMPIETLGAHGEARSVESIELRGVCLSYRSVAGSDAGFSIGPIDLTLRAGEITFIVGGNGSGKSTLAKILSLHYVPAGGSIRFAGEEVTPATRDRWRASISAIYADFHLFPKLYGVSPLAQGELLTTCLRKLGLEKKVTVRDGCFSSIALSQGQKKRLALLVAYLEDRPVYVFDEWAADQDPQFREIFYEELLPELKARGKLIVVISHDQHFYPRADRIVRMQDGRIEPAAPGELDAHERALRLRSARSQT